ncbi:MAG: hypothetical protein WD648_15940 [Planctomycetaceae bacterium]
MKRQIATLAARLVLYVGSWFLLIGLLAHGLVSNETGERIKPFYAPLDWANQNWGWFRDIVARYIGWTDPFG